MISSRMWRQTATMALVIGVLASTAEAKTRVKKRPPPPPTEAADETPPELEDPAPLPRGISFYEQGRFATSIQILEPLIQQTSDTKKAQQARLYLGLNYLALGNNARASELLNEILDTDPNFSLLTFRFPPTIRSFFDKVKEAHKIVPILQHTPPTEITAAQGIDLAIDMAPMAPGYEPQLFYRVAGQAHFAHIDLSPRAPPHYLARLPAAILNVGSVGYQLEYFAQVASHGVVVAQLRNERDPFSVPVSVMREAAAPVYTKWWLWTVLGVVVAGAAATTVVLVTTAQNPNGNAQVVIHVH